MFFQFLEFLKIDILTLFICFLWILRVLVLIILGAHHRKNKEGLKFAYLFLIVGSIDIIWALIYPRIAQIILHVSEFDTDLYIRVLWAFGLAFLFLNSIPFGITFTIIGFKNLRNSEIFLKISGFSFIIGAMLNLSMLALIDFPPTFDQPPLDNSVIDILLGFFYLGIGFNILASSLLLIYAIKIIDLKFGIIALLFLFEWIIYFIYYFYALRYYY